MTKSEMFVIHHELAFGHVTEKRGPYAMRLAHVKEIILILFLQRNHGATLAFTKQEAVQANFIVGHDIKP